MDQTETGGRAFSSHLCEQGWNYPNVTLLKVIFCLFVFFILKAKKWPWPRVCKPTTKVQAPRVALFTKKKPKQQKLWTLLLRRCSEMFIHRGGRCQRILTSGPRELFCWMEAQQLAGNNTQKLFRQNRKNKLNSTQQVVNKDLGFSRIMHHLLRVCHDPSTGKALSSSFFVHHINSDFSFIFFCHVIPFFLFGTKRQRNELELNGSLFLAHDNRGNTNSIFVRKNYTAEQFPFFCYYTKEYVTATYRHVHTTHFL